MARYRAITRIIAISQFVARSVEDSGIDPARIAVVYDGVAVPPPVTTDERERARNVARARWGVGEGDRLLGCVSHLSPEKGQEVLLRALHLLAADESAGDRAPRVPPRCYRLLLAGAGNDRARLEALTKDLGISDRVIFAGFVEDVNSIYSALDIFLFPSLAEPLGSSLLDAMGCGLPCIAVASGGVPEVIEDGVNGVLLSPLLAPAAFADAIASLIADPAAAERLGVAARDTVAARFSASHMVDATLAVYEEALAQGRP
jgi:glycosyltransferase involved in cell wall biosynthesis